MGKNRGLFVRHAWTISLKCEWELRTFCPNMNDYWSDIQGSVLKFNLLTFFILSCVCDRRRALSFLLSSDFLELVGDEEVPEFSPLSS